MRARVLAGAIAVFSLAAAARADGQAASGPAIFDLKGGTLTYRLVHKLHEVTGTTSAIEGKARVLPDGSAQVQVRAKLASFDSGNSNRDVHMREVTREAEHPYVSVRGTLSGLVLPLAAPVTLPLKATIEMNGQKQEAQIPIAIEPTADGLKAKFTFPISLDALHVERPELLFVKVDDAVNIDGELNFSSGK